MKSLVNEEKRQITYPCLMISKKSNHIWLLVENATGVLISLNTDEDFGYSVGDYSSILDMANLVPFKGSVTLFNE